MSRYIGNCCSTGTNTRCFYFLQNGSSFHAAVALLPDISAGLSGTNLFTKTPEIRQHTLESYNIATVQCIDGERHGS